MSDESFYGVTLTGENSCVEWEVLSNDENNIRGRKFFWGEAKENEFNVVKAALLKTFLTAGEAPAVNHDIEFYETSDEVEVVDMDDEETDEEDEAQPKKKQKLENNKKK